MSDIRLQPLRIPHGWSVHWNALYEIEPTPENIRAFLFTSSSLLSAVHSQRRVLLDVAWMPPDEPTGRYVVVTYQAPQARSSNGRPQGANEFNYYRDGIVASTFETALRAELVEYLELALLGR